MKKRQPIRVRRYPVFLTLILGLVACDDGMLNTFVTTQSLTEYMQENPDLDVFLNNAVNYRSPLYLCVYDMENETSFNNIPLGKYESEEGIAYGELTAVEMPVATASNSDFLEIYYTPDGYTECPVFPQTQEEDPDRFLAQDHYIGDDVSIGIRGVSGYLSENKGGEQWNVCGENQDEPCQGQDGLGTFFNGLEGAGAVVPPAGLTAITVMDMSALLQDVETSVICWDPDDSGSESSSEVITIPVPYEEPYTGFKELPPMTTGTLHLHRGEEDCSQAEIADADATLALPAEATFGPPGSEIAFEDGTVSSLLITGADRTGIPQEARLRIVPLVHWTE